MCMCMCMCMSCACARARARACASVHVRVCVCMCACACACARARVRVRGDDLHAQRLLSDEDAALAHRAAWRGVRPEEGDHRGRHRSTLGVAKDGRLAAQDRRHLHGQRQWQWQCRLEAGTNVPPQQPRLGIEAAGALRPGPGWAGSFWPCGATAELVVPRSMPTHAPAAHPSRAPPPPPRLAAGLATAAPTAAAAAASRRLPASRTCLG